MTKAITVITVEGTIAVVPVITVVITVVIIELISTRSPCSGRPGS
jgi:hypothetical protein